MNKNKHRILILSIAMSLLLMLIMTGCSNERDLEAIKKQGTLIVGTSADYPPHEFVEDGEYKGFEIDIIKEVGNRMGLEIEIQDMSFDTLIASLKQGKIDCVIASMSATPERRQEVDFTEPYFKATHTFVTKVGSTVRLTEPEDIKDYHLGFQTGTTHEKWVITNLIETGIMPENQIYRYDKADLGILDVSNGRIDAYLIEAPIAKRYLRSYSDLQGAFEFDANPVYGGARIAVQKGQSELLNTINDTILQMMDEGYIDEKIEEWFVGD